METVKNFAELMSIFEWTYLMKIGVDLKEKPQLVSGDIIFRQKDTTGQHLVVRWR